MTDRDQEFCAALDTPDPFALPKGIRGKVKSCCQSGVCAEKIEYLWLTVEQTDAMTGTGPKPTLEHWLNVVDEAASLGAKWLVVAVSGALAGSHEVLELCHWAQHAHEMSVALHTTALSLDARDVAALKRLDLCRLRLFVSSEALPGLSHLEAEGIRVRVAEAVSDGHACGMPQNMLYVNGKGELYTCGRVKGNDAFHMGSIYARPFSKVVADPALPHAIPLETPYEEHSCDGCPPLLANAWKGA